MQVFIIEHSIFISKKALDSHLFYKKKLHKTYRNINSIPDYEEKSKIVCHPNKKAFNIDKYLFLMSFLLWKRLHLLSLFSYHLPIL